MDPWAEVGEALMDGRIKAGQHPSHRTKKRWRNWGRSVINTVTTADLVAECTPSGPASRTTPAPHDLSTLSQMRSGFSGRTSSSWRPLTYREMVKDPAFRQIRVEMHRTMQKLTALSNQESVDLRKMLPPENPYLPIPAPKPPQALMGLTPEQTVKPRTCSDD